MTAFKVMTWNVENLFQPAAGAPAADQQRHQNKLTVLAGVILAHDPDVVALQEIGAPPEVAAPPSLANLQAALNNTFPNSAVSNAPDDRGIRVAFLSKHPITNPRHIVNFPAGPALAIQRLNDNGTSSPITRMSRGALAVTVTKGTLAFTLVTAHLKSKLLSFPGEQNPFATNDENKRAQVGGIALHLRTAEAVTLRLLANDLLLTNPQTRLILLGDLNDVPEAQTSLLLAGPTGSEIGTAGFDIPDQKDRVRLFNLAPLIPEARRFSRIHRSHGELIDQIFVSERCVPLNGNTRTVPVVDSLVTFRDNLPNVGDDPGERAQDIAPDHAPVVATFDL